MIFSFYEHGMEPSRNTKAIVFDLGRVLCKFDHMEICRNLSSFTNLSPQTIHRIIFEEDLEKSFDEGKANANEFFEIVKEKIQASHITFSKFSRIWSNIFSPNPGIEELLSEIDNNIAFYLLSNTNILHWQYIRNMPVLTLFFSDPNKWILSFEVGVRKPASKIFKVAAKRTGVLPKEILYIDDNPDYVAVFKSLGVKGIVYDCEVNTIDFLREALFRYL